MKSHRIHKPLFPNEEREVKAKGRFTGSIRDGKKRRLDQLTQAIKTWWMYYEWIEEDKIRKAQCVAQKHNHRNLAWSCGWGDNWFKKSFKDATARVNKLWAEAIKDGIV